MKEFTCSGKAMGTDYDISIVCKSEIVANACFDFAQKIISEYESKFSRFKDTSELSILNNRKFIITTKIFQEVFEESLHLHKITDGAFNPLFQIEQLGYKKSFDEIKDANQTKDFNEYNSNIEDIIFNSEKGTIKLLEGQKLDFGGFLKGYLAEKICRKIMFYDDTVCGAIVNIGGDLCTQGLDENNNKFVFEIHNPTKENSDISIELHNKCLATSGTYKRKWLNRGAEFHHILDKTGAKNPENDIISVSVVADRGSESEAYTKMLLSDEKNIQKMIDQKIQFIAIKRDGSIIKN